MNSLRECVTCKDIKDKTYLLPCLHPTCVQCVEEIVQDAKQKNRKLPSCRDCGEAFFQDKLTPVPGNSSDCDLCVFPGPYFCRKCKERLCEVHRTDHLERNTNHVIPPFCHKHSTQSAFNFCTHCKLLICNNCTLAEHNKPPHLSVTLEEAAKATSDSVKKDVAKLLKSDTAIEKEIKKHTDIRTELEKGRADLEGKIADMRTEFEERVELEAKIADIRKEEKATTLQIEDLEKTKALLLTTQAQANALASTATTLSLSTLLRLQSVITTRVSNLQAGLRLISTINLPVPIFNRVSTQNLIVSNNNKTITKNATNGFGYGISDDGCSSGVRSWRITINSIEAGYNIMFGIWKSRNAPVSSNSSGEANAWLVGCQHTAHICKAGTFKDTYLPSPLQSGDVISLTVDADQSRFTVQNTTRGWSYTIDQLPTPNPAYYPHVVLYNRNNSVTIEAAS